MREQFHHSYLALDRFGEAACDGATRPGSPTTARARWRWARGCRLGSSTPSAKSGLNHGLINGFLYADDFWRFMTSCYRPRLVVVGLVGPCRIS